MKTFNKKESLEKMQQAMYPIIEAPFFGEPIPVMLKELNETQIRACGDFSLIETFESKLQRKVSGFNMREKIAYSERMRKIAEAALFSPTYLEIMSIAKQDKRLESIREQKKNIDALIVKAPKGKLLSALKEEREDLEVHINFFLPLDFLNFITCYVLGIAKSDIKEVSENMLLEAAILATRGHDNPADHLDGRFTPFMITDINKRAWHIYEDYKKNGPRKGI